MAPDSVEARSTSSGGVELVEHEREEEVSDLDAGALADLLELARDGDEEAIAALREAERWPEAGTQNTGAQTGASKAKEKAEAPWRKLSEKDLLPRDPKLTSRVWEFGRCALSHCEPAASLTRCLQEDQAGDADGRWADVLLPRQALLLPPLPQGQRG